MSLEFDDNSDSEDQVAKGNISLKKGFNLNALLAGKGDTFEINFDGSIKEEDNLYNPKDIDLSDITAAAMSLGLDSDEDEDINSTPFEKLAKKMVNVTEDGKIKKYIKREGVGETPPCNSSVSIHYSSYLEFNDEPTDYIYMKKVYTFRLGNAIIYGLNLAVQSMKVNEKALFLIHPDYAFGKMGHPPRIPPNATFLFQIELLRYVDSGAALEFNNLTPEEKRQFPIAHKTALALIENAKEYFKHNLKLAIREYNKAVSLLEECTLSDMNDQEKQQKLLFQLYSNLAVCYTKDENPRKACIMCNNIYALVKNTSIKIPAKVFFHNGRALYMLGDYKRAREKLLRAQKIEPQNIDINNELAKVSLKMNEDYERERAFAKALLNNNDKPKVQEEKLSNADSFTLEIRSLCENLMNNSDQTQFKLPAGLTKLEKDTAKVEAEKLGLRYKETINENKGNPVIIISKF